MRLPGIWFGAALAAALIIPAAPSTAGATNYKVDPDHTSVGFTVRHLLGKVRGRFDRFEGQIVWNPAQPRQSKVQGSIDATSINTNVAERDKHLRSPDFFDVEKFPKITFTTTGVSEVAGDGKSGKLDGVLTIHGVARPVVLAVSFLGDGKDPWGNKLGAFTATTRINRKDFGLNWNEILEAGGVMVGEEIDIEIEAEGLIEG